MKRVFIFINLACIFFFNAAFAGETFQYTIHGIEGEMLSNVISRLEVEREAYGGQADKKTFLHFYEHIPVVIQKALEPYGYFKPAIRQSLKRKGLDWFAYFDISRGPAIRIASVRLSISGPGKNEKEMQTYLKTFPLKAGDRFRADLYQNAKEDFFKVTNRFGYIKAYLAQNKVIIDLKSYTVKIIMDFKTGDQFYFGEVNVEQGPYAEQFLKRFIDFKDHTPFSTQALLTLQQEMANTYYFQQVNINPDFENIKNHRIPINLSVTAPKAKKFSLGIGYGTYTGVRFTSGLSLRRIGQAGQHLDAQLKLSQILSGIALKYYLPGQNPLTDQWLWGANYQVFHPKNGKSKSMTLSAGFNKKIHLIEANANLNYLVDRYKVENVANTNEQISKLLYPSLNLSYVSSDDPLNPRVGQSLYFNLQGASDDLLSSTHFIQGRVRGKYLISPTSFSRLLFRGDLGYTASANIKQLPLSMRYFAGGINSIRGYPDSSIGPGKYLVTASIEYQNHLFGNWDGALFYDIGNAMNHWGETLNRGEGAGIIYRSLLGPIKLYVGRAMSKPGHPYDIELSIGPEF